LGTYTLKILNISTQQLPLSVENLSLLHAYSSIAIWLNIGACNNDKFSTLNGSCCVEILSIFKVYVPNVNKSALPKPNHHKNRDIKFIYLSILVE
jgi:hypothetical protein